MKTQIQLISGKSILALLFSILLVASSCKKEEEKPSNEVKYNVALTGAEEVPPVTTSASGKFEGTYNKETNKFTYTITYSDIMPTNMHFHVGEKGVAGPPVIPIDGPYTSPMNRTATLTDAQETELLAGKWYVNIHSEAYPTGELRGQLMAK